MFETKMNIDETRLNFEEYGARRTMKYLGQLGFTEKEALDKLKSMGVDTDDYKYRLDLQEFFIYGMLAYRRKLAGCKDTVDSRELIERLPDTFKMKDSDTEVKQVVDVKGLIKILVKAGVGVEGIAEALGIPVLDLVSDQDLMKEIYGA